jgi:hypothetical protein
METLAGASGAPANADNAAPAATGEADANPGNATSDGSAPSVPEADTSAPKVPAKEDPVQKRIDQLTREKYDALRDRDRRDYEVERLRAELEEARSAKQPEVAPQNEFPTLEQFGFDEGKYAAAVAAHYSKLATEQGTKAAQEALRAERERQSAETAQKTWTQREQDFKKSKPDYEAVALKHPRDGGPTITPSMAQIIKGSDVGPQVAYYLGENVDKANAIASLHPIDQAREIGRIEARLELAKAPPKPAVSQAPPPPSRIEADEAPSTVRVDSPESDALSDKEWTRRRNAQEAARLRKQRSG